MKSLPNVTLIAYDNTDNPDRTLAVLDHCQQHFEFAESVLVCRNIPDGAKNIVIANETGYQAGQDFEAYQMIDHVTTEFSLFVSWDGYIVNPNAWKDEWLHLDFIGAPWPPYAVMDNHACRVGNTGFCLRSKRFMEISAAHKNQFHVGDVSDIWACRTMRRTFERKGIKYATLDQAADFSWELDIPEYPKGRRDAFGFHNLFLHPEYALQELATA